MPYPTSVKFKMPLWGWWKVRTLRKPENLKV
jgi:hypothetical protein